MHNKRIINCLLRVCPLIFLVFIMLFNISTQATAHHAKEYLLTESYALVPQWGTAIFIGYDYFRPDYDSSEGEEWEFTPTITFGLHDRLMLNAHTHYLKIEEYDGFFEAWAVGLQGQITAPDEWIIDVGLGVEYEVPFKKSRDRIDGKQLINTTLILSKELPNDINVTGNFHYSKETKHGDESEYGYAAAGKGHIIPPFGWLEAGIEFVGTFDKDPRFQVAPGLYISPHKAIVFKVGASFGFTEHTEDLGIHTVFAFNF